MASKEPESIIFRFRLDPLSLDWQSLSYIRSFRTANQMVLKAVNPFWLPVSAKHRGFKKGNPLRQLAIESVIALYARADQLCGMFAIDPAEYGYFRPSPTSGNTLLTLPDASPIPMKMTDRDVLFSSDDQGDDDADSDGLSDGDRDLIDLGITPRNFNLAGL